MTIRDRICEKKDYIWNTLGSFCNAANTVVMLAVVANLLGSEMAGLFSLCYATSQILYNVASFELRSIQITEVKREYSFGDYFFFRTLTVIGMLLVAAFFFWYEGYGEKKLLLMWMLCIYMVIMAYSDLFQGCLQANGKLAVAGKSLASNLSVSTVSFSIILLLTHSIFLATFSLIAVSVIWLCCVDWRCSRAYIGSLRAGPLAQVKKLFTESFPLFISVFVHSYIINSPRYAIDRFMTLTQQSFFGYFMLSTVTINLFMLILTRPGITPLAFYWSKNNFKKISNILKKQAVLFIITMIALFVCCYYFGISILGYVFHADLSGYDMVLMLVLVGGVFSALSSFLCVLLTILRKQRWIMFNGIAVGLVALYLPGILVEGYGFYGAAAAYTIEMGLLFMFQILSLIHETRKILREEKKGEN